MIAEPQLDYLTTQQACARYPIGKTTLFQLIASGDIESCLVGRRRVIIAASVEAYFDRLANSSAGRHTDRVRALLASVDGDGRIDVTAIPEGTTLVDLEAAKRLVAETRLQPAS